MIDDESLTKEELANLLTQALSLYNTNQAAIILIAKSIGWNPIQLLQDAENLAEDPDALQKLLTN